ncbi:hypothetical protein PsYK624_070640 [Phanerochaete sordida]|uniref:Uncharacterized protein n=1 Tax=Phanerochaete sordida TaxID=48140 RepID=A0A9P3G7T8_9APHY|nr:hypothetical protein PsYK624_070640 [Phanerochaete sordida]
MRRFAAGSEGRRAAAGSATGMPCTVPDHSRLWTSLLLSIGAQPYYRGAGHYHTFPISGQSEDHARWLGAPNNTSGETLRLSLYSARRTIRHVHVKPHDASQRRPENATMIKEKASKFLEGCKEAQTPAAAGTSSGFPWLTAPAGPAEHCEAAHTAHRGPHGPSVCPTPGAAISCRIYIRARARMHGCALDVPIPDSWTAELYQACFYRRARGGHSSVAARFAHAAHLRRAHLARVQRGLYHSVHLPRDTPFGLRAGYAVGALGAVTDCDTPETQTQVQLAGWAGDIRCCQLFTCLDGAEKAPTGLRVLARHTQKHAASQQH